MEMVHSVQPACYIFSFIYFSTKITLRFYFAHNVIYQIKQLLHNISRKFYENYPNSEFDADIS